MANWASYGSVALIAWDVSVTEVIPIRTGKTRLRYETTLKTPVFPTTRIYVSIYMFVVDLLGDLLGGIFTLEPGWGRIPIWHAAGCCLGEKKAPGSSHGQSKTWSRNNTHHFSKLINWSQEATQPQGPRNRKHSENISHGYLTSAQLAQQWKFLARKYAWVPWIRSGTSVWAAAQPRGLEDYWGGFGPGGESRWARGKYQGSTQGAYNSRQGSGPKGETGRQINHSPSVALCWVQVAKPSTLFNLR